MTRLADWMQDRREKKEAERRVRAERNEKWMLEHPGKCYFCKHKAEDHDDPSGASQCCRKCRKDPPFFCTNQTFVKRIWPPPLETDQK